MKRVADLFCAKTSWRGREAYLLGNGVVRLVNLTGGGHVAEFRFTSPGALGSVNPMWIPPWHTIEPYRYRTQAHLRRYGPPMTGKLLCGLVGHNLCLDYFGPPSEEEAAQGLSIHGEAPVSKWRKTGLSLDNHQVALTLSVELPVAGLAFSREIKLSRHESVVYFKETVKNERKADHFFHWTQHVTLGPPFLSYRDSRIAISATKGKTYPHGYEGKALLASSRQFRWPLAPGSSGGRVDLTRPFSRKGLGFVTSALLDPRREVEFVAALNFRLGLLMGYCFRRSDFPWVAIWEENRARAEAPWNGRCQARGLEFGSTPFPVLRRESFALGSLFGTLTFAQVPARSHKTVCYLGFLARVPRGFTHVRDIRVAPNEILIYGKERGDVVRLLAPGIVESGLI